MNPNLVVAALAALPVLLLPVILNAETRDVSPRDPLTLEAAVELALDAEEPTLRRLEARAEAIEHQAVADAQLPDPSVTSRLVNVPTDTLAFDQADMTQFQVGLRQEFPPGRTLALRGRRLEEQANAERARLLLEARQIALETREAWLELAYRTRAMAIIADSRRSVAQQIDSLAARFATGGLNAQAVLRAELELSLLDDSLTEHQREAELAHQALPGAPHPRDAAGGRREGAHVQEPPRARKRAHALLHLSGYEVSEEDIRNFRQWGAPTAGHPECSCLATMAQAKRYRSLASCRLQLGSFPINLCLRLAKTLERELERRLLERIPAGVPVCTGSPTSLLINPHSDAAGASAGCDPMHAVVLTSTLSYTHSRVYTHALVCVHGRMHGYMHMHVSAMAVTCAHAHIHDIEHIFFTFLHIN